MTNDFKELSRLWTYCIEYPTNQTVIDCEIRAAHRLRAKEPTFMAFQSSFQKGQSVNDVKRMEVSLFIFAQYATLRFLVLQTLINTYGADQKLPQADHYYKTFRKQFDDLAEVYSKYSRWAIRQILKGHNCNNDRPYLYRVIELGTKTAKDCYTKKCIVEFQCDPLYDKGVCSAKGFTWRVCLTLPSRWPNLPPKRYYCYSPNTWVARPAARSQCYGYLAKVCKDVNTYWYQEIGKSADLWEQLSSSRYSYYSLLPGIIT